MRFLVDMSLAVRVAEWLRAEGHDAVHLRDQKLDRLPDEAVFAKAVDEGRIVVTCDLDFGEIVAFSGGKKVSVVVFRLADARPARVITRLAKVVAESGPALDGGAIVVVEELRHRIRHLPVGT